jgi:hypothetical protein
MSEEELDAAINEWFNGINWVPVIIWVMNAILLFIVWWIWDNYDYQIMQWRKRRYKEVGK